MQTNSADEDNLSTKKKEYFSLPFHIQISISATENASVYDQERGNRYKFDI